MKVYWHNPKAPDDNRSHPNDADVLYCTYDGFTESNPLCCGRTWNVQYVHGSGRLSLSCSKCGNTVYAEAVAEQAVLLRTSVPEG